VIMAEAPEGGVRYLPIWQRLERERDTLLTQNDVMAAVRKRQARLDVGNTVNPTLTPNHTRLTHA
jgi:hypothetical protein